MLRRKRPACVTFIGWFWIISGSLSLVMLAGYFMSCAMMYLLSVGAKQSVPPAIQFTWYRVLFDIAEIFAGILSIVLGIYFLKLQNWARTMMEIMTWITPVFAFIYLFHDYDLKDGFSFLFILGVFYLVLCIAPCVIILSYLRSVKVKNAMIDTGRIETTAV